MNASLFCPICGTPQASPAPQGLCPACLLKAGVPTGPEGSRAVKAKAFVPPEPADLAASFPQLEIIELIGQGGMGAVYRARQPHLDRIVALKILPAQADRDPGFAERFQREARALAKLNHPNIVAVHDFGASAGYLYFVMEFVDGLTLRQLLTAGRIEPGTALAIVPAICDALQYAHDRGIVHRDIKPENILLGKRGGVKIADFGLAKLMDAPAPDLALTGAQDVMGTPHYMAPEQVERPREVDHRADIYSLGVVFYQMLTGELPLGRFAAPSRKVAVDVRLDEIVLRALEKEPQLRYQQVSVLKTEVESVTTAPAPSRAPSAPAATPTTNTEGESAVPAPVGTGFDYRTRWTMRGQPWLHIATGRDPATGKRRTARGIVAIGTRARGVIAVGGYATGVIAIGGVAVGAMAVGVVSLGLVALGALSLALLFAGGGVAAAAGVAMGGIASGYLAYGDRAFGMHPLDSTIMTEVEADRFFGEWASLLTRGAGFAGFVATLVLQAGALAVAVGYLWRRRRVARHWLLAATSCAVVAVLLCPLDLAIVARLNRMRVGSPLELFGPVSQISPLSRHRTASDDYIIMEGWLVEHPATEKLAPQDYTQARTQHNGRVRVTTFMQPFSVMSGFAFTISTGAMRTINVRESLFGIVTSSIEKTPIRIRMKVAIAEDVYHYDIDAHFPNELPSENENEPPRDPFTRVTRVGDIAAGEALIVELGSFRRNHTATAVFRFTSWDRLTQEALAMR